MFGTGNLTTWDSTLTSGDQKTDIANFFDGRFMYLLDSTITEGIRSTINKHLSRTLVGTALVASNYYILVNAYSTDTVPKSAAAR